MIKHVLAKIKTKISAFSLLAFCTFKSYADFELPSEVDGADDSLEAASELGELMIPLVVGVVLVIIAMMNLSLIIESIKEFTKTKELKTLLNNLGAVAITMVAAALIAGYITGFVSEYIK